MVALNIAQALDYLHQRHEPHLGVKVCCAGLHEAHTVLRHVKHFDTALCYAASLGFILLRSSSGSAIISAACTQLQYTCLQTRLIILSC